MSILGNDLLLGSGDEGYNLTRSLRFRSSASAYLNRTPATNSGSQIFSYRTIVKRGTLGTAEQFLYFGGTNSPAGTLVSGISFSTTNNLVLFSGVFGSTTDINLVTSQVFRDPAAFYDILISVDTTQATASNRVKVYVNGVQVTAFSTATYPSLNYTLAINNTYAQNIGRRQNDGYFDGYLTETIMVSGQALTPSNFGETDTATGVWKPKRYAGTYGTNGFYLPFTDNSALTTSSNVGLGKDFSGNGNYWTTNNISITAGTTYDSMTDVPTLTSATAANFAVLNPINVNVGGTATVEYANLRMTTGATGVVRYCTIGMSTGKWYAEFIATGGAPRFGVSDATETGADFTGSLTISKGSSTGELNINGTINNTAPSFSSTALVSIAYDADTRKVWLAVNGTWQNYSGSGADPATGTNPIGVLAGSNAAYFGVRTYNCSVDCNFGQRAFTYTPPTGFVALNTYNLPDSTIVKGNTVMDATLYTGNGSTQTITNAGGFKPDFVWIKNRNNVRWHILTDSVRGTNSQLFSNDTAAQEARTDRLTAFNSNGFSVGSYTDVNLNADTFVGWQWQAGQGTTSSNTSGTITSTVSVNASAGFSVVTYTGNGVSGATVGHGLGVAPKLVIVKKRNGIQEWMVGSSSLTSWNNYLVLNTTAAQAGATTIWNDTAPTSSVFSLGSSTNTNGNTNTFVAYCWAPIAGYSAFGSYTGNGSNDGPFIFTGFRPRFVLIKSSSNVRNWRIIDTARDSYNYVRNELFLNVSDAETSAYMNLDILSNGFKPRYSEAGYNGSGESYIYMAFAENPLKFALAR